MEPTNIFFVITTVFVGVLIIIFLIVGFYVWRILKAGKEIAEMMKDLSSKVNEEGMNMVGAAKTFREKAFQSSTVHKVLKTIFVASMGAFFKKTKKSPQRTTKKK